jgi:hypothetical protein
MSISNLSRTWLNQFRIFVAEIARTRKAPVSLNAFQDEKLVGVPFGITGIPTMNPPGLILNTWPSEFSKNIPSFSSLPA